MSSEPGRCVIDGCNRRARVFWEFEEFPEYGECVYHVGCGWFAWFAFCDLIKRVKGWIA